MERKIELSIDEKIYREFYTIVQMGKRNIEDVLLRLIFKTIQENNIDWLYSQFIGEVNGKNSKKIKAISLFEKRGNKINRSNINFSTKLIEQKIYWINPKKNCLKADWYLIFNDPQERKLYLFFVPMRSGLKLILRSDSSKYNLSIDRKKGIFLDNISGESFEKFLIDEMIYDSLI